MHSFVLESVYLILTNLKIFYINRLPICYVRYDILDWTKILYLFSSVSFKNGALFSRDSIYFLLNAAQDNRLESWTEISRRQKEGAGNSHARFCVYCNNTRRSYAPELPILPRLVWGIYLCGRFLEQERNPNFSRTASWTQINLCLVLQKYMYTWRQKGQWGLVKESDPKLKQDIFSTSITCLCRHLCCTQKKSTNM